MKKPTYNEILETLVRIKPDLDERPEAWVGRKARSRKDVVILMTDIAAASGWCGFELSDTPEGVTICMRPLTGAPNRDAYDCGRHDDEQPGSQPSSD
jgi:hypothetical protein